VTLSVGDRVHLVDTSDPCHRLWGTVVRTRLNVADVKVITRTAFPFKPERFWVGRFDIRSGNQLDDHGAWRLPVEGA